MRDFLSRRRWWLLAALAVLVIVIIVGVRRSRKPAEIPARITRGDLVEAAYAVGTVKAERTYNLKTGVPSRVIDRAVRLGDRVKKGDLLMTLEGFPGFRAPFDGVITALAYEKGELVFAQTVVLTLVDLNSLYLELSMDERTISSIRHGQPARISFEGTRSIRKEGKVRSVYASDGSFLVIVDADFTGLSLLPGMTGDVAVETGSYKNQLLVPLGAVATAGHVTVLRDQPTDVQIETGPNDGKFAVVTKGDLKEGEAVQLRASTPSGGGGPGGHP